MSALARFFNNRDVDIFGYDLSETSLTRKLEAEGMKIHYTIDPDLIPEDLDLVVYTPAISKDNVEFKALTRSSIPMLKRAELLGLISKDYKCIAVAGTHGKTSTSAVIAHLLKYCGLDVSAFIGGILAEEKTNFIQGHSDYVVLEADEYDRSFLHLYPEILLINSLDADHLDIYGNRDAMIAAYEQLTMQVRRNGLIIMMSDFETYFSETWRHTLESRAITIQTFAYDFFYDNVSIEDACYHFEFRNKQMRIDKAKSRMPGLHNIANASAAVQIANYLGFAKEPIVEALDMFKGIRRRFEIVHEGNLTIINDYAHHPEELKHALDTVNNLYQGKRILVVFQPHLYSRTRDFFKEFAVELEKAYMLWLLEIYPAREQAIPGVESELIFNLIRNDNKRLMMSKDIVREFKNVKHKYDVLILLGASDIDKYHELLIEVLK